MLPRRPRFWPRLARLTCLAALAGCADQITPAPLTAAQQRASVWETSSKPGKAELATTEAIAAFEGPEEDLYRLGPGDKVRIDVWGRPELSGARLVGPDGRITLPVVGAISVINQTTDEAAATITRAATRAYTDASATVAIDEYTANRVLVLGRVSNPGVLHFETRPTLLEAITRAGSLPIGGIGADKAALTRCAIFRGRDRVLWVDLKGLLTGHNLGWNIRLKRDDLVYIPDAGDQLVYVLGYVRSPGAYPLTPDMSLLDLLAQAGGPTEDAAPERIRLVRPAFRKGVEIDMNTFLNAHPEQNMALEEGDILYIPPNWLAEVGYVLQKLSPATNMAMFGAALAK